ncbi:klc-2 [Symbiodinium necroappetens]|uniref:Klc-2 protein n=1 Tax=Symbiodinium necroappetens TaxID=1628268 RepID=A0A812WB34_9DINO|nr:klc-2 [Symbiodinium necroappetens]
MNNLAGLLQARGRYEEAEPLFRQGLEICSAKLGEEHPRTLNSMNNLAGLLQAQRRHDEAEPLYRQALAGRRAKLGDSHPDTMSSMYGLASLLRLMGQLEEAEQLFREGLEKTSWRPVGTVGRARLGDSHPETMNSMHNLAYLLTLMGQLEEAEQLFREELETCRSVHGAQHEETVGSAMGLAEFLKDPAEGRAKLGDSHPDTMSSMYSLASLLRLMGQLEEAEQLFREDLETCRSVHGAQHEDTINSIRNLAEFLEDPSSILESG